MNTRNVENESLATNMAMLTVKDAKKIASLERDSGRSLLRACLGWPEFNDEVDLRESIQLDTVYDSLMFCVQKGFQWDHICFVIRMVCDILEESKGKHIPFVIKLYTEKCSKCVSNVPHNKLKLFTEYFFSTFMAHYKLYQYVFTKPREDKSRSDELLVETVETPAAFSESKPEHIWEYEERIHSLDETAEKRRQEREAEVQSSKADFADISNKSLENIDNIESPLTREKLLELIANLTKAHVSSASVSINAAVSSVLEDLEYKLERTSIPRPADLGPPQRYQIKTPAGSKKHEKSAKKSASRAGSRTNKTVLR